MGYMNKRLMFSAALMMVLLSANAQKRALNCLIYKRYKQEKKLHSYLIANGAFFLELKIYFVSCSSCISRYWLS